MTGSKEWTSIPTVLTDLLPTCNLVVNAQGCTGRNRARTSSAPSHQIKPKKEQRLPPESVANITRLSSLIKRGETLTHAL